MLYFEYILYLHKFKGDSDIQAYAVRLFMDPAAVKRVPDMEYVHGSTSCNYFSMYYSYS
jgi:hypothetical protein